MLSFLHRPSSNQPSAVAILLAAATGAIVFTLVAGALVYTTTQRLIAANQWVQHTQEVLSSLQRASLLTERVEYYWKLYLLTGHEEQIARARSSVVLLNTSAAHLHNLVSDNNGQKEHVESLATCATTLTKALESDPPRASIPESTIQQCQQTIGFMIDQEQLLLKERDQSSQKSTFTSVTTEFAFISLSFVTSLVLFGFLIRDAFRRERGEAQMLVTNEHLARSVKALEDRAHELAQLNSARDELQLCVEVEQVVHSVASSISLLLPDTRGGLCMIDDARRSVDPSASWGNPNLVAFSPPESCCGLRAGQPRWRRPTVSEIHCSHFSSNPPERYLCQPISAHGSTLGILYIECDTDELVQAVSDRMESVRHLLQIAGMAIATIKLQARLEKQSVRDPLTGLSNRRFLEASLDRELHRAKRRKLNIAVFMVDVDHFKRFNDSFGHAAGDTALKAIASVLRNSVRADDIACRYGGEEFTLILPDISPELACERAESIRRAVANLHLPVGRDEYSDFSISIGVAFYPSDGLTPEILLHKADQALYEAKHQGRNQVTLSNPALLEV